MHRLERKDLCRQRRLLRRQLMLHLLYQQGNQDRRICSGGHSCLTWVERESRAHLYTSNARLSLCRKRSAVSNEGHRCQACSSRMTLKNVLSKGALTAIRVSFASFTSKRNHFFSGFEQEREPASVSRWNIGSIRETLT